MSVEISKNLGGVGTAIANVFSDIEKVHDNSSKVALSNFLQIVQSAISAKKAGLSEEMFTNLLTVIGTERDTVTSGEIEVAGSVTTGLETADGSAFNVSFTAGGTVAGIGLSGAAGYNKTSSKTTEEKSSQNFRILARWVTVPKGSSADLVAAATAFAFRLPAGVNVPDGLTAPAPSPAPTSNTYLDMIQKILPIVAPILPTGVTAPVPNTAAPVTPPVQ